MVRPLPGTTRAAWLELQALAPVHDSVDDATLSYRRADGGLLAQASLASLTPSHDVFVVQLVRTPHGATVLNAAGYYSEGTAAASWYVVNRLLPMRPSLTASWYVVD